MGIFKTKLEIGPETILQRKPDLLFNEIEGEVVMLSIENSEYYGMDKVGSRIWELLEKPITLNQLISKLMEEYEVNEQHCKEDIYIFLQGLINKNLITTN
ncbi:MAG: lasso peptide biosynthesis PqqD family chaperone [Bacteroidales bacterium]|nr:lasso peptide biosynthesis PqqD family chaperone [Bacteroidales bacterium]